MLTDNQVQDIFNDKFKTQATPDDIDSVKNMSTQQLANLDKFYVPVSVRANQQATGQGQLATGPDGQPIQYDTAPPAPPDFTKQFADARSSAGYDTALKQYNDTSKQLLDVDKTLRGYRDSKLEEIAQSGGIVNEGQVNQMVAQEEEPIQLQKANLLEQLKLEQGALSRADEAAQYTTGLSEKTYTASLRQQQASQRIAVSDASKVMSGIANGTIDPKKLDSRAIAGLEKAAGLPRGTIAAMQAKLTKPYSSTHFVVGPDGKVLMIGITPNRQIDIINTGVKAKVAKGTSSGGGGGVSSPADVVSIISSAQNKDKPLSQLGGLSVHGLEQAAKEYIFNNEKMPSLGLGQAADVKAARTAIVNYAGHLADTLGMDIPTLSALFKANSKAVGDNVSRMARIETVSRALTSQFPRLEQLAAQVGKLGITESDLTAGKAKVARKFGSVDAGNYVELIQTIRGDYAAMQAALAGSRGGQFFSYTAQDAIPIGLTPEQYSGIAQTILTSAQNSAQAVKDEVQSLFSSVPGINTNSTSQPTNNNDPLGLF